VKVVYPDGARDTPDMSPKKFSMDIEEARRISGLDLTPKRMCELLEQARYSTKISGGKIEVHYPAYRQDIMHQRDVIEDMIISYGYNRIEPATPRLPTTGASSPMWKLIDSVAEAMTGMGFLEVLSYILTNKNDLFARMNAGEQKVVEIENFVSSNWCVFRSSVLPSLMDFLSKNKHREYPQKVFEAGDTVAVDMSKETRSSDVPKMAAATCGGSAGYEDIAGVLDSLLSSLGLEYTLEKAEHPSFITGRTALVRAGQEALGTVGEVHPAVLEAWGIEKPVAAFELDMERMKAAAGKQ